MPVAWAAGQYQPFGLPEAPGVAGAAVAVLHVVQTPLDLGGRVGLPVGAGRGHLRARQGLDQAVGAAGGVGGVDVPVALVIDDPGEAPVLGRVADHLLRGRLRRGGRRRGLRGRGGDQRAAGGRGQGGTRKGLLRGGDGAEEGDGGQRRAFRRGRGASAHAGPRGPRTRRRRCPGGRRRLATGSEKQAGRSSAIVPFAKRGRRPRRGRPAPGGVARPKEGRRLRSRLVGEPGHVGRLTSPASSNVTGASKAARRVARRSALRSVVPSVRVRTTVMAARPPSQPRDVARQ